MSYDYRAKKTVIVLASNLSAGVAANVIGHLALAIGHRVPSGDMGADPLVDASNIHHRGISKYPVIVTKVKSGRLRKFILEARAQVDLLLIDYPETMLTTGHDDELAESLRQKSEDSINYLGAVAYGNRDIIEALSGKFMLWGAEDRHGASG